MLVDIVSKNGNLLINVVQRPDGSLDPEAEQILAEMATWIAINGEGIYETRPWLVHGEGRVKAKGGHFNEDYKYSANDIRFTMKGENTLYAFALGWPTDGKLVIRSLAKFPGVTGKITNIALLGSTSQIKWDHTADALTVEMPAQQPCKYAVALKITGENLRGFKPELAAPQVQTITPDAAGNVTLLPDDADLQGSLKTENQGGQPNIGFWDNAGDSAAWKVNFKQPGKFKVAVSCATTNPNSVFVVEMAGQKAEGTVTSTGAWDKFTEVQAGTLEIKQAGDQVIKIRPRDAQSWKAINLRRVKLTKIAQ
jgi:alpha-L-fucosidase